MKKYLLQFFLANFLIILAWTSWHFYLLDLFLHADLADSDMFIPQLFVMIGIGLHWVYMLVMLIAKLVKKSWWPMVLNLLLLAGISVLVYAAVALFLLVVGLE